MPLSMKERRHCGACKSASAVALLAALVAPQVSGAPKVVVISLDGATPRFVDHFMRDGTIPHDQGLGLLRNRGIAAETNVTVNPSLTAVGHIAIATGSTAASDDRPANTL